MGAGTAVNSKDNSLAATVAEGAGDICAVAM